MTRKPDASEYPVSHAAYVQEAPEGDILETLRKQGEEIQALMASIPADKEGHRYAPGKWSIRELMGHLNDAEKCFEHRAYRFGRGDASPLPGFDEDAYVAAADFDRRPLAELLEEFTHLRAATLATFRHLPAEAWDRRGTANGKEVSVRALAFVIAGHAAHHLRIVRERYLA